MIDDCYWVEVSFRLSENFKNYDEFLFELAGRPSDASGAGFGWRDHTWYFERKVVAEDFERKLRKRLPLGFKLKAAA